MNRVLGWLISPVLTVICLLFLMALTFFGTVFQVENGLHAAQEIYYNSYFMLLGGFLPFPGTQTVLAVLTVNLLGYLIQLLLAPRPKPGIVLIHLGLLLLLAGGAVTHHFAEEASLSLYEGETSNTAAAYYDWELAVWTVDAGVRDVRAVDTQGLKPGAVIRFTDPPLEIEVDQYYRNTRAFQGQPPEGGKAYGNARGITRLEAARPEKDPERNLAGLLCTVRVDGAEPRPLLLFAEDTAADVASIDGKTYTLELRRKRMPLPLSVTLVDFQREMHPGTEMAKRYASDVLIQDGDLSRQVHISMNKPLRYRGFTFFQSSFMEEPDGTQASVFAVTRNYGRLLPYIATTVIVAGMMLHFVLMMIRQAARRKETS